MGYDQLNRSFKATSKTLFGSEIGELKDFEKYLSELVVDYQIVPSCVSGKPVMLSSVKYQGGSRFASQEEIGRLEFKPMSINEIKDIDSLLSAASERAVYSGNKLFGKNSSVEISDNCTDCSEILRCHNMHRVKNAAYCSYMRESEGVFGVSGFPNSVFSMRCIEGVGVTRCFEAHYTTDTSDVYYGMNCSGCRNGIFVFNMKAKNYVIGNLQLPKDRYLSLKGKLVSEMAELMRRDKRIFSVVDIALMGAGGKRAQEREVEVPGSQIPQEVSDSFRKATRTVLGKEYGELDKFRAWLLEKAMRVWKIRGARGTPTYKVALPVLNAMPAGRLLTLEEAFSAGEKGIELGASEAPKLEEVLRRVAEKSYFTFEFKDGQSQNVVDTPSIFDANNGYHMWDMTHAMYAAYGTVAAESKYIYGGGYRILHCEFCINCHDTINCKACLGVDSSYSCSACFFCHNCEGCTDCMFCFNAKSLHYAVANVEVGREKYMRFKKMLLDYMNAEFEKKGALDFDIFTIGKKGKKK
jgi:hypothetical protein